MEHNETEQTTSTPAGADADVVCTEPCVFGIMSAEPGDAAGRLVKEGAKIYRYGYLDKVLSVTDGDVRYAYGYTATPLTAFGDAAESQPSTLNPQPLFTGKPHVDGLGHAFLFRNYRAGLGKWLSADPLGYPDGWNQMAYCNNEAIDVVDFLGGSYDRQGLTSSELSDLNQAFNLWLIAATVGSLFPSFDLPLTLSFLKRYIWELGDQELDYERTIGDQIPIRNITNAIISRVKRGNYSSGHSPIGGGAWTCINSDGNHAADLSHSLGGVIVYYWVEDVVWTNNQDAHIINFQIRDPYDFHRSSLASVSVPGLSYFWGGGDTVYDVWMAQLAEGHYAQPFTTYINWWVVVE